MTDTTHAPADMLDAKALEDVARAIYGVMPNYGVEWRPNTNGGSSQVRVDDPWEDAPDRHADCLAQAEAAINAYRASLPAGNEPVAVKPLKWHHFVALGNGSPEEWFAHKPEGGSLTVIFDKECDLPWVARPFPRKASNYATAEEAMAELEAEREQNIRSALASPLTPSLHCPNCNSARPASPCWKCGTECIVPSPQWEYPGLPDIDRIRALAKEVGYAIGVHGSQQRDLDLIAAPWVETAVSAPDLAQHIASGINGRVISPEQKPLGRWSCNIQIDGWFKLIDLSVAPAASELSRLSAEVDRLRAASDPLTGKYGDVLAPFVAMMDAELHANSGKGDRPGWLSMSREEVLLEIYYHLAKAQKAALKGDAAGIREFAADVANMSMMLVDVCGELPAEAQLAALQQKEG